jgi:hypothetical protein
VQHPRFELKLPEAHPRLHLTITRMLVEAYSEDEARRRAAGQAGSEGAAVWATAECALHTPPAVLQEMLASARAHARDLENTDYLGFEGQQRLRATNRRAAELEELCRAHGLLD